MYTKYNTISMLPAEIMEAYCDKMTIEKIETLYEKVKQRFLELPEEDVQMQLEQMGQFLQSMLIGKNCRGQSGACYNAKNPTTFKGQVRKLPAYDLFAVYRWILLPKL